MGLEVAERHRVTVAVPVPLLDGGTLVLAQPEVDGEELGAPGVALGSPEPERAEEAQAEAEG